MGRDVGPMRLVRDRRSPGTSSGVGKMIDELPPVTPTLDARGLVADDSNKIGAFLDWLSEQGIRLARWGREEYEVPIHRRDLRRGERGPVPEGVRPFREGWEEWLGEVVAHETRHTDERLIGIGETHSSLLHRYFSIDPAAEEAEMRAVLDYVRRRSARLHDAG